MLAVCIDCILCITGVAFVKVEFKPIGIVVVVVVVVKRGEED